MSVMQPPYNKLGLHFDIFFAIQAASQNLPILTPRIQVKARNLNKTFCVPLGRGIIQ